MPVHLYDTLTQAVKPLEAVAPDQPFRYYCCGPTVYGPAHIGNFRTFLLQDVLRRVLELEGVSVHHVRNVTDVDDKTIRGSLAEGVPLRDFTDRWTAKFHADCAALNLLKPHDEPRATDYIPEQVALVQRLLDTGHAYRSGDGSVYFRVAADPCYGELAHLDCQNLQTQAENSAGQPNDADEYDRDSARDFALWKARKADDGDCSWPAPWGEGRPGWHLECSAMIEAILGPTIDLHGGGIDLCFPHHTNEIAQSEHATGCRPLSRHWFHCAHLLVDGAKMSKSLGNFYRLDDLTALGYHPMEVRFALLAGHYRQQLNFTLHSLDAARSALDKIAKSLAKLAGFLGEPSTAIRPLLEPCPYTTTGVFGEAWACLTDDLNIPAALGLLFSALRDLEREPDIEAIALRGQFQALGGFLWALGLDPLAPAEVRAAATAAAVERIPAQVSLLAEQRWQAKAQRNFAEADRLRAEVTALGWTILDRKDGFQLQPNA